MLVIALHSLLAAAAGMLCVYLGLGYDMLMVGWWAFMDGLFFFIRYQSVAYTRTEWKPKGLLPSALLSVAVALLYNGRDIVQGLWQTKKDKILFDHHGMLFCLGSLLQVHPCSGLPHTCMHCSSIHPLQTIVKLDCCVLLSGLSPACIRAVAVMQRHPIYWSYY